MNIVASTAEGFDASEDGTGRGAPLTVAPTLTSANDPSRSPQSAEVTAQVEAVHKAQSAVRRLTPTECERLQSFPDGWTILSETLAAHPDEPNPAPDSHRYAQMGNAVTVNVAKWLGRRIMEAEAA